MSGAEPALWEGDLPGILVSVLSRRLPSTEDCFHQLSRELSGERIAPLSPRQRTGQGRQNERRSVDHSMCGIARARASAVYMMWCIEPLVCGQYAYQEALAQVVS